MPTRSRSSAHPCRSRRPLADQPSFRLCWAPASFVSLSPSENRPISELSPLIAHGSLLGQQRVSGLLWRLQQQLGRRWFDEQDGGRPLLLSPLFLASTSVPISVTSPIHAFCTWPHLLMVEQQQCTAAQLLQSVTEEPLACCCTHTTTHPYHAS